jgi:branched-chain amino acid transport system ATP-binding protein
MTTELAPAPASTDVVLRLHDVHTYYGAIHALRGLNVEVRRREIVTLIGANGAGKTTTLRTISGLLHARTGTVELDGKDITKVLAHELVTRGIGHAPEGRRIFSRLTVYENLLMGGFTRSKAENEEQVGTLSGGEQQMLAIGRALMTRPSVLLLDEPSLGLAPILVQQIFKIIREINERGMTILLVEQNALQALSIANRGYVLQNGEVVLTGSSGELMVNETVRKAYLGED